MYVVPGTFSAGTSFRHDALMFETKCRNSIASPLTIRIVEYFLEPVSPIVIILQFFSGVFFVFTQLPSWMQQVAAIFPLKWLTQGMRSVFLPDSFASQEVAKDWETGKTVVILLVWLAIGIYFSVRKFKWDRD